LDGVRRRCAEPLDAGDDFGELGLIHTEVEAQLDIHAVAGPRIDLDVDVT
jgi:hypothetical protein